MSIVRTTYACDNCEKEVQDVRNFVLRFQTIIPLSNGEHYAITADLCLECASRFDPLINKILAREGKKS